MEKTDFLRDCMSEFRNVPVDAFNREFCVMCSNRECSRSWGNQSIFDARVKDWKSKLFDNVQRLVGSDLANTKFEPVQNRLPEISTAKFETSGLSYDDIPDTEPEVATSPASPAEAPPPKPAPPAQAPPPAGLGDVNTPFDQPVMIGARPKKEPEPAKPGCVFVFDEDENG